MNFTGSPYEKMMKEKPRPGRPAPPCKPPKGSPCWDCSYWNGSVCVGVCYRDLIFSQRKDTSGQLGPKSEL